MIRSAALSFPESVYKPPPEAAASTGPSLNLNLPGGVNVSLGGPAGTGVYRTAGDAVGIQTDGIKEGVKGLLGKVKQGVDQIRIQ
jgi:vacuolar protein sorting-associated protein 45